MTKNEAGKLGQKALRDRLGDAYTTHMSIIGKLGYQAFVQKYGRKPVLESKWAIVDRQTNEIVTIY